MCATTDNRYYVTSPRTRAIGWCLGGLHTPAARSSILRPATPLALRVASPTRAVPDGRQRRAAVLDARAVNRITRRAEGPSPLRILRAWPFQE